MVSPGSLEHCLLIIDRSDKQLGVDVLVVDSCSDSCTVYSEEEPK